MSIVKKKFHIGLNLKPGSVATNIEKGDLETLSVDGKAYYHNGTTSSPIVTESQAATLTNKTIDISTNTVTSITNTNISASAAIAFSKLAALPSANILVGNGGNVPAAVAVTGDVSLTNAGVTSVLTVGGSSSANIATAETIANAATSANTSGAVVRRDGAGNFSAGTITASLSGNATNVTGIIAAANGGSGVANTSTLTLGTNNTTFTTTGVTSVTLPTSGTLATLAGVEVFTNKDINGGTASNTSRITIPKDTKVNLDALTRKQGTVVYGTDTQTLYVDTGTTLVSIGGNWTVNNSTSLGAGGAISISTTIGQQTWRIAGTSAVTLSTTPFGGSAPADGTMIILTGTDNTNTVTITNQDISKGCVLNGDATLGRFDSIQLQYNLTDDRYIEISRSF